MKRLKFNSQRSYSQNLLKYDKRNKWGEDTLGQVKKNKTIK